MKGIKLDNSQFLEIPDHETEEWIGGRLRKRCFTDGIGIISAKFAKKLAAEMNFSDKISHPSAFQIRCGGFKGNISTR
jgi:hypothetical protein